MKPLLGAKLVISLALLAGLCAGVGSFSASPADLVSAWMERTLELPTHEISDLLGLHSASLPDFASLLSLLFCFGLIARHRLQLRELRTKLALILDSTDDGLGRPAGSMT